MTFDPFGDFATRGYLRNTAALHDPAADDGEYGFGVFSKAMRFAQSGKRPAPAHSGAC